MGLLFSYKQQSIELKCTKSSMELTIPSFFLCPISLDLMKDPVTLSTGITYDRDSIDRWIQGGHSTCPVSNQPLSTPDQIPNHSIRRMIQSWCTDNSSNGVERIPTPHPPITSLEVHRISRGLAEAATSRDGHRCLDLVRELKSIAMESERNKNCIAESDAVEALSAAFESFSDNKNPTIPSEILSILAWMRIPDTSNKLCSSVSLRGLQTVIDKGDSSSRNDAVLTLKRLVTTRQSLANTILETQGMLQSLVSCLNQEAADSTHYATLTIISRLARHGDVSCLARMGAVPMVVRIISSGDRAASKMALTVLNAACDSASGREKAYESVHLIPILRSKISATQDTEAEASVSIIWKLWKGKEEIVDEMVEVNLLEKLLVMVQVGCRGDIKKMVKDLLRATSARSRSLTMDFWHLKVSN